MKLSKFQTDGTKEVDGVWVDIGDGARVLVARIGNPKYRDYYQRATKPYRRQIRTDTLAQDIAEKLYTQALAETILLGWEGLLDSDSKEIRWSRAKALEVLTDYKDFRDLVAEIAQEQDQYRTEEVEATKEALGNG